jgi:hypothetical protein
MKRIILIIAFGMMCLASFSQNKWLSTRNQSGTWSAYSQKWIWSEPNIATIPIFFGKTMIWMENKDETTFTDLESQEESKGVNESGVSWKDYSWTATDNRGRRCRVSLVIFNDPEYDLMFTVMYDGTCFRFYCKRTSNSIDKF